jgi:hypothetical protein
MIVLSAPFSIKRRSSESARSARQIEPRAPVATFDLDDPDVRIERDLAREPPVGLDRFDPLRIVSSCKQALNAGRRLGGQRLRRGSIKGRSSVQAVDLDENRARFCCAAPTENGDLPFHAASSQVGGDPEIRPQPHQRQCALRAAALSCLTSRGVISVVGGSP